MVIANSSMMNRLWRNDHRRLAAYQPSVRWNAASSQTTILDSEWSSFLACNSQAHIIGVNVSDTTPDMTIATVTVTANSRNSRPIRPPISSSGMNTAVSDSVID